MEAGDAGAPLALFLTATVCALWAQNSGRNAWLWFFVGLFFHLFAMIAMLAKK